MSINIFNNEYNINDTTKIKLYCCNIEEIPKEIQYLTQLEQLYLNDNKIKEIPTEIKYLTQLNSLDLSTNFIKEIPKEIQYLTQLTDLDLHINNIEEIPKEIQYYTQLTKLYLYKRFPKENEGFMTVKKIALIKNETIGKIALEMGLHKWYILSNHAEQKQTRTNLKKLGCLFEAFIGAMFLDLNKFHPIRY